MATVAERERAVTAALEYIIERCTGPAPAELAPFTAYERAGIYSEAWSRFQAAAASHARAHDAYERALTESGELE